MIGSTNTYVGFHRSSLPFGAIGINIKFGPLVAGLGGVDGTRESSWEAKEREIYLLQQVLLVMPLDRLYKYLRRISSVLSSIWSNWD